MPTDARSTRSAASATDLVAAARLAPSSHNTQPWRFRVAPGRVDLFADRARRLPVNDPDDRELEVSCGCALESLVVAAAARGLAGEVRLLPAPDDRDHLARVDLRDAEGAADDALAALAALAPQLERRRTHRAPFAARPVPPRAVDALVAAARDARACLRPVVDDAERHALAELVAEGDHRQWEDRAWRAELARWLHPRRRGDGLTVPPVVGPLAQGVVRTFDLGGSVGAKDERLAETAPVLAVLWTEGDDRASRLTAGRALQRVLLTACAHGLQAGYLNQPLQVAALRPRVQDLVGGGAPQVVLRLGFPEKALPPAPRRPVEEVVEVG